MSVFRNRLLQLFDAESIAALGDLETVTVGMRQRLDGPDSHEFAYFIEEGVASVVADFEGKLAVELGIIGREGMVGLEVVYGDDAPPYQTIIQVEGRAFRVPKRPLADLIENDPAARAVMLRFAHAFSIQVASTAMANGRNKLDERLARWLLMVADRAGPTFPITHEFISIMLGVRRSGVTVAIQVLEGLHLIRAARASITIVDREGLIAAAAGAYGFAETHYARLLGVTS